jgi:hypothetical protein
LEHWDPKKHPVKFSFQVLNPPRDIISHIEVYSVDAANPAVREKAPGNLAENTAGKIIGKIPALAPGKWKVVTRYSSGGGATKEPRTVEFAHELTVSKRWFQPGTGYGSSLEPGVVPA